VRGSEYKVDLLEPLTAEKAQDVWALGVSFLHLRLGRAPIVANSDLRRAVAAVAAFVDGTSDLGLGEVEQGRLKSLLVSMLDVDPKRRPSILQVQAQLLFL
jgi:serine/threonine protein kinase